VHLEKMEHLVLRGLEDCLGEDREVTLVLMDLRDQEVFLDHQGLQAKMGLMVHQESKGHLDLLEDQGFQACMERKGFQVKRVKKEMLECLALLEHRDLEEKGVVQERQDFLVKKVKKESPLPDHGGEMVFLALMEGLVKKENEVIKVIEGHLEMHLKEHLDPLGSREKEGLKVWMDHRENLG